MAAKKITLKKEMVTPDKIINAYMEYVLENEKTPKSVFKFCKENNYSEEEFYNSFGSFEGLQIQIWNSFFIHSMNLAQKSEGYEVLSAKDKMLTFFYTFFEILTENRSYVLFIIQEHRDMLKNLSQLKGLRSHVKKFASQLIEESNDEKQLNILKHPVKIFSEGAWLQTLLLLKFWKEDTSPSFEKTDVMIEKSVRAIFDVFETTPLESVLDLGKFLWKEKMV
jgi:hypothetical protein